MIDEYEFYHGAVLRCLIVEVDGAISIVADDRQGRIDSFALNGRVAIHIKHSTKRMSPWQFTFSRDNIEELIHLDHKYANLFLILVCNDDGVVTLTPDEFLSITGPALSESFWIRISRPKGKMYEISGNDGSLEYKKAQGLSAVVEVLNKSP